MRINKTNITTKQRIASGANYVLLIGCLIGILVLLGISIVGASHVAAFINYLWLS